MSEENGNKLFCWSIGFVLVCMTLLLLEGVFISGIAMVTDDRRFDSGWALLTTKPYTHMDTWQPAKLNYARNAPGFNKRHFDMFEEDHNNYRKDGVTWIKLKNDTGHS